MELRQTDTRTHGHTDIRTCWAASSQPKIQRVKMRPLGIIKPNFNSSEAEIYNASATEIELTNLLTGISDPESTQFISSDYLNTRVHQVSVLVTLVSLFCLLASAAIFTLVPSLHRPRSRLHVNMFVSLALSNTAWLLG